MSPTQNLQPSPLEKWITGRSVSCPNPSNLSPGQVGSRKECLPPKTFNPLPWTCGVQKGVSPTQNIQPSLLEKWSVGRSVSHPKPSTLSPGQVECRKECLPPKTLNPLLWISGVLEEVPPTQNSQPSHLDMWSAGRSVSHPKPSTLSPGKVDYWKECLLSKSLKPLTWTGGV